MAGGLSLGAKQGLLAGKPSELPRNPLFQVSPFTSQTEYLFGVITVRFKVGADTDGNKGPARTEWNLAWIGAPQMQWDGHRPPLSRGEEESSDFD